MVIDFANATRLVKGGTYVLSVPPLEFDEAVELRNHIATVADDADVKIIVLIGNEVTFTEAQVGKA